MEWDWKRGDDWREEPIPSFLIPWPNAESMTWELDQEIPKGRISGNS